MEYPARSLTGMMAVFLDDRTAHRDGADAAGETDRVEARYVRLPRAMTRSAREGRARDHADPLHADDHRDVGVRRARHGQRAGLQRAAPGPVGGGLGRARRSTAPARGGENRRRRPRPPQVGDHHRHLHEHRVDQRRALEGLTVARRVANCSATLPKGGFVAGPTKYTCIAFQDRSGQPAIREGVGPPSVDHGGVDLRRRVGINAYKTTAEATGGDLLRCAVRSLRRATDCDQQERTSNRWSTSATSRRTGRHHRTGAQQRDRGAVAERNRDERDRLVTYVKPARPSCRRESTPRADGRRERSSGATSPSMTTLATGGTPRPTGGGQPAVRKRRARRVNDAWLDQHPRSLQRADLKNVLIYTTGPIDLKCARQGQATFVSTDGSIRGRRLRPDGPRRRRLGLLERGRSPVRRRRAAGSASRAATTRGTVACTLPIGVSAPSIGRQTGRSHRTPQTFNGGLIGWIVDLDGSNFTITNHSQPRGSSRFASSGRRRA